VHTLNNFVRQVVESILELLYRQVGGEVQQGLVLLGIEIINDWATLIEHIPQHLSPPFKLGGTDALVSDIRFFDE
jgi:hypothetical protein